MDFPAGSNSKADGVSCVFPSIAPLSRGIPGVYNFNPDDDLYDSCLTNGEESGPLTSDLPEKQIEKASEQTKKDDLRVIEDPMSAKLPGNVLNGDQTTTIEETPGPTSKVNVNVGGNADKNMIESEQLEAPFSGNGTEGLAHNQMASSGVLLSGNEMASTKGITISASLADLERCSPDFGKEKGVVFSLDSDTGSLDSLPDIVDNRASGKHQMKILVGSCSRKGSMSSNFTRKWGL